MHAPHFVPLAAEPLRYARRDLHDTLREVAGSAHVAEALARSLGFRTHAALLAELPGDTPRWRSLDESAFLARLSELTGNSLKPNPKQSFFDTVDWTDASGVIETCSAGFHEAGYLSLRARAWRNMMVLAVNEGLDRGYFTMRPDDNRWSATAADDARLHRTSEPFHYEFTVGDIPAMAMVNNGGFGELRVAVALWPTKEARRWLGVTFAGFLAGEAVADGWVERQDGAYLQTASKPALRCRRGLLDRLAAIEVEPRCYADRGSFRF